MRSALRDVESITFSVAVDIYLYSILDEDLERRLVWNHLYLNIYLVHSRLKRKTGHLFGSHDNSAARMTQRMSHLDRCCGAQKMYRRGRVHYLNGQEITAVLMSQPHPAHCKISPPRLRMEA